MGVMQKFRRGRFLQRLFDLQRVLAGREPRAVADPENMGVDGDGRRAEGDVHDDVGGFAPDPRQFLKFVPVLGDGPAVVVDQHLR